MHENIEFMTLILPDKELNVKATPYLRDASEGTLLLLGDDVYKVVRREDTVCTVELWKPTPYTFQAAAPKSRRQMEKEKDKCPTCEKPKVTGRRVRGEWHNICSNGHDWNPKPEEKSETRKEEYRPRWP